MGLEISRIWFVPQYIKGETNSADGLSRNSQQTIGVVREERNHETKNSLLKHYHEISGHGSTNSMKLLLKQRYKWGKMYADIDEC